MERIQNFPNSGRSIKKDRGIWKTTKVSGPSLKPNRYTVVDSVREVISVETKLGKDRNGYETHVRETRRRHCVAYAYDVKRELMQR